MSNPATISQRRRQFRDELPVHERIRNRRDTRRMTGVELARRGHVSAAYVSLIERGLKIPHETVAAALARALDDDQELYRHWARSGRYPTTCETRRRYDLLSSDPGLRRSLAEGEDLPLHRINLIGRREETVSSHQERPCLSGVVAVPVLPEDTDPGRPSVPLPTTTEALFVDARLLPEEDFDHLFAYCLSEAASRRVRPLATAGDYLVMTRKVRRPAAERIHAVRLGGRVVLTRLLVKGDSLLLLPTEGRSDFELLAPREALDRVVAASVLVVRWCG